VVVHNKQKVRLRPGSTVGRWLDLSPDAIGIVMCRYRIFREGDAAPDRLDVCFDESCVAWGVPEDEFEVVAHSNDA